MNVAALADDAPIDDQRITVQLATSRWQWLAASALLHDHLEWIRTAAGFEPFAAQPELVAEMADLPGHYDGMRASLLLATAGPIAAGTVAVRIHPDGAAELKRMYVRPIVRGRGVADRLVESALAEAHRLGATTVWLETLRGVMERAIAVYRRHGFVETAPSERPNPLEVQGVVVMARAVPPAAQARPS